MVARVIIESIRFQCHKNVDFNRLYELFQQVGWTDKTRDQGRLKAMVANSQVVVTAWDGQLMVGFARCVTDHVFNGQINNVVVDASYRRHGIGSRLVSMILESNPNVTYVLRGDLEGNLKFYSRLGFEPAKYALVFKRKG